ncbi:hypothetical protein [uncultured Hoeflea sp.]|uniref:hypothetical protein n=1 Tax=uncultured Hoeflea sp. TaxID=538666 RepID=UPI002603492C|nr:hypothetical protein [uncultured Hoeflea sp.]
MKRYKPAAGAPPLRTTDGEAFPETGKMIDPTNRYYARLIKEEALEEVRPGARKPKPETDKPAASAAPEKESRK